MIGKDKRGRADAWKREPYGMRFPVALEEDFRPGMTPGGIVLKNDLTALRHPTRGVDEDTPEPPPTVFPPERRLGAGSSVHRAFAMLAGTTPGIYAEHCRRYGYLGDEFAHGGEPLLYWRWHVERLAFLLALFDAYAIAREGRHEEASARLVKARPAYPEPSSYVWHYPAGTWARRANPEPHNFAEHPLVYWGSFLDSVRYQVMGSSPEPMSLDLSRVYHPDHENADLAATPYFDFYAGKYRLAELGQRRYEHAYAGALGNPAIALEPIRFVEELRDVLRGAIAKIADRHWRSDLDPGTLAPTIAPRSHLGVVYEAFFREIRSGLPTRAVRVCAGPRCTEPIVGNAGKRFCSPTCRIALSRLRTKIDSSKRV